jgi:hypothetical protein
MLTIGLSVDRVGSRRFQRRHTRTDIQGEHARTQHSDLQKERLTA